MRLSEDTQSSRLPERFPVGTVYVVVGCGGERGHLRVSSRYVVLPGGRRIDVPVGRGAPAPAHARRRNRRHGQVPNKAQSRPMRGSKKIMGRPGTGRQQPR
jgi:hypothetical protein